VYLADLFHLGYKEGDHVALVGSELTGTLTLIYPKTLTRWEPPHENESMPDEKHKQILERIASALRWQNEPFEFEGAFL